MAKRQRRPAAPGEFEDPLSNYEPRVYEDSFEQFLNETQVGQMQISPFFQVAPETPVARVLEMMAQQRLFCALVVEEEKLVGIFSERDVLNRVAAEYDQVRDLPVRELMTRDPVVIYATDTPAKALNLMAVGGFRHIPVLDVADRVIGILGPRRVAKLLEKQFA